VVTACASQFSFHNQSVNEAVWCYLLPNCILLYYLSPFSRTTRVSRYQISAKYLINFTPNCCCAHCLQYFDAIDWRQEGHPAWFLIRRIAQIRTDMPRCGRTFAVSWSQHVSPARACCAAIGRRRRHARLTINAALWLVDNLLAWVGWTAINSAWCMGEFVLTTVLFCDGFCQELFPWIFKFLLLFTAHTTLTCEILPV